MGAVIGTGSEVCGPPPPHCTRVPGPLTLMILSNNEREDVPKFYKNAPKKPFDDGQKSRKQNNF